MESIRRIATYRINAHQRQSAQRTRLIALGDLTGNRRLAIQSDNRDLPLGGSFLQHEVGADVRRCGDGSERFGNVVRRVE